MSKAGHGITSLKELPLTGVDAEKKGSSVVCCFFKIYGKDILYWQIVESVIILGARANLQWLHSLELMEGTGFPCTFEVHTQVESRHLSWKATLAGDGHRISVYGAWWALCLPGSPFLNPLSVRITFPALPAQWTLLGTLWRQLHQPNFLWLGKEGALRRKEADEGFKNHPPPPSSLAPMD